MNATAIVTYARGWPALAATRSLGTRGVRVVCGDSVPWTPSSFSRHCARSFRCPDAREDPAGFLAALEEQVRREQARGGEVVLLPVHAETVLLAEERARFEALGARLALPPAEAARRVHDKGALAEWAEARGVATPPTHRFASLAKVYAAAHSVRYPAFVKLRTAAAGVGVEKVCSPEELVRTYRRLIEDYGLDAADFPLVQEFAPGEDLCVSVLYERGRLVASHAYRNLRQFPRTTGAGVLRETTHAPEAVEVADRLLAPLAWHGVAQLDFRWDGSGTPQLIEVNPRLFGGLTQAVAAGVDYPWLLFRLALGRSCEVPRVDPRPRTVAPVVGLLASAQAAATGEEPSLRAALAPHRGARNDVWRRDDPLPVLGLLYPLALLFEHGTLSTALVLSEARAKGAAVAERGWRELLRPNARTFLATGVVFLLSVFCTQASALDGTLLDGLFSLPAAVATRLSLPPEGPAAYALFHLANFCFLWVLAAGLLRLREAARAARSRARLAGGAS